MAIPKVKKLSAYRGNIFSRTFQFTRNGAPAVLPTTGWVAHVKKSTRQVEPTFALTVDASQAGVGKVTVSLVGYDTEGINEGAYVYDLKHTPTDLTYVRGPFDLLGDVTRV